MNIEKLTDKQLNDAYDHIHSEIFINYQRIKSADEYYIKDIFTRTKSMLAINKANKEIVRHQHKLAILECEKIRRNVYHDE